MTHWSAAAAVAVALILAACGDDEAPVLTPSPSPAETGTREVSWDEAVALLEDCRVTGVMQTHALDVYLTLDDGSEVHAKEPGIDDVFDVTNGLEPDCQPSSIATE